MSLLSRFALMGLWASAACAQSYTVTVTETVTECASSCYSAVSQCTSTEYICTSSGIKLPTGSTAIVSIPESLTSVTDIISLPTVSIPSTSKFANTSSITASYTSTLFETKTTLVVSESNGVSFGSSALAGETSESSLTSLYDYSTSTLTFPVASETATDLETMPTLVPSVGSSALVSGTSGLPETSGSTTVVQGTTEQPSESFPFNTETIPTQGVSTDTYVSQRGSSTIPENSGASTATEGGSTTTLKSVVTSQIIITESISTVFTISTEQPALSSEGTESPDTSSQAAGASSGTEQSLASTGDITSEATSLTQLTSILTLTNSVIVSESSGVPQETTVVTIVESSSSYDTAASETEVATLSTIEIFPSETSAAQTDFTASGVSPQSTKSGIPKGTTEAAQSTSTPCTSTEHTHIYENTTIIHSTAQEEFGSSALAGSFTSTYEGTGYTSSTSDVIGQTTTPVAETSEIRAGVSTSEYLESTSDTAVGSSQTSILVGTEESTLLGSATTQASSGILVTPSQSTQAIQTPPISPTAPSDSGSTAPHGYDFGNPGSSNDGWPTASFASTVDAATGFSSFTTLLTTSKVTTDTSSTSTAIHEPEYEPPAYEPPSYREPAYVRKRWALGW
ncbi:hypothetical protein ACHAPU_001315 [Fusarium lateritium]